MEPIKIMCMVKKYPFSKTSVLSRKITEWLEEGGAT